MPRTLRFLKYRWLLSFLAVVWIAVSMASPVFAAGHLTNYLEKVSPGELFEGADRYGGPAGEPPMAPVYRGSDLVGYSYLNSDVSSSVGYSGKPIHIIVGTQGQALPEGLLDLLLLANPTDAYRLLNLGSGGASSLSGIGGLAGNTALSPPVLIAALAVWVIAPLALATTIFSRREL